MDFLILYWIFKTRNDIEDFQSKESPICPVYFCDEYVDPDTDEIKPGSLCYTSSQEFENLMTAYRYTDSSKQTFNCQKYLIDRNIIH